jgi:hypothetical protein
MLDLSFLFSSLPDDDSRGGQLRAFGFDPQHFVFTVDDDQGETVYYVSPAELIYFRLPQKNVLLKRNSILGRFSSGIGWYSPHQQP